MDTTPGCNADRYAVVGRILKVHAAPVGSPWMWTPGVRAPRRSNADPRLRDLPVRPQWRHSPRLGGENSPALPSARPYSARHLAMQKGKKSSPTGGAGLREMGLVTLAKGRCAYLPRQSNSGRGELVPPTRKEKPRSEATRMRGLFEHPRVPPKGSASL
jgi:hypothetical protein